MIQRRNKLGMDNKTKLICVACPKGCHLQVDRQGETWLVSDQGCKRGDDYVKQELTDPRRMVATTVRIKHARHALLPVYTSAPFPKGQIEPLLRELRMIHLFPPLKMGEVVYKNALGTGIDILASRDMN